MGIHQALILTRAAAEMPPPPQQYIKLVSNPYPLLVDGDALTIGASFAGATSYTIFGLEEVYLRVAVQSLAAPAVIVYTTYSLWPAEDVYLHTAFQSADVVTTIAYTTYSNYPPEDVYVSAALQPGSIAAPVVINYVTHVQPPDEENVYFSVAFQSAASVTA